MGKRSVPRRIGYAQQRAANDRAREEKLRQLCQNGITPKDMEEACKLAAEKAYEEGKNAGINGRADALMSTCYAAALLAAHKAFGFGHERCLRFMRAMDYEVVYSLSSMDLVQEVFERLGIKINFAGALEDERIMEVK